MSVEKEEQYSEGDICIVAQTSRCLQFHTARIQTISGNTVSVVYLSTNEKDIIPFGSQVRSLKYVGRGIEKRGLDNLRQANQKKDSLTKKSKTGEFSSGKY